MQALFTAATGAQASTRQVDVIANNLANVNTTSFKAQRAVFKDLMYNTINDPGVPTTDAGTIRPSDTSIGLGVALSGLSFNTAIGTMEQTDNDLDVAINGKGYFKVTLADGTEAYTRDGAFQVNGDGLLVTQDGLEVSPSITIPSDALTITINTSGEVLVTQPGSTTAASLGSIEIFTFINEAGLKRLGDNRFLETEASGTPTAGTAGQDGFGSTVQGVVEGSNVTAVVELMNLIKAQNAFEHNTKVMETADQMAQSLSNSA